MGETEIQIELENFVDNYWFAERKISETIY